MSEARELELIFWGEPYDVRIYLDNLRDWSNNIIPSSYWPTSELEWINDEGVYIVYMTSSTIEGGAIHGTIRLVHLISGRTRLVGRAKTDDCWQSLIALAERIVAEGKGQWVGPQTIPERNS